MPNIISGLPMYFYGGTTLLQRKESWTTLPFFFYTLPVDRLLQLVQRSHYIKQVNPPKFYLQHLVWGSYLSSLHNGTKCKTWLNSPGSPLLYDPHETLGKGCGHVSRVIHVDKKLLCFAWKWSKQTLCRCFIGLK